MQVSQLLGALEGRAAALADGVLLCGDFNTDPYDHPPPRSVRARCVPAVLRHPLGLRSAYPLPEDAHGRARWWTTWKKRGEHEVRGTRSTVPSSAPLAPRPCIRPCTPPLHPARAPRPCPPPLQVKHTIDYIFHDAGLRATRILAPPQEAELEPARLPGLRYPSDHLSLVAELEILS